MNPKDYILGEEAYRQSEKSLKALVTHLNKGIKDPIYLTINLNNPIVRENDYIPRLIPLSNKFSSPKLSSMKILLITKNDLNGENYRNVIKAKESPISELFHDIITLKKLKKIALNKKKLNNFYNEFDMIICDNRISKLLFKIIGGDSLYSKKKNTIFNSNGKT
ncbi:hypothetical protein PACTADRAFT_76107 [Pachysolen tannophilus NRRL Y-2460]|uniref:Uncharacterized protein n=1 Tax=Pachysolen tannophilus NRRL Y-2460 TaxID=669874 RepID=A0A1E4TV95_PACTA|nr:hypothetical protein PACTADRAFT_76107 [Pachysolen tannophilus NRRL Y-2460]